MSLEYAEGEHHTVIIDLCTTTPLIVLSFEEEADNFVQWLPIRIQTYNEGALRIKLSEWRAIQQEINSKDIDFTLLQVDMEDVEPKDAPKYVDAFISKAFYRGVELNDEQLYWLNKQKQYVNKMANESLI